MSADDAEAFASVEMTHREFPCPNCSPTFDRVEVHEYEVTAAIHADKSPDYASHVRETAAHKLVDTLIRSDAVRFVVGKVDRDNMTYPLTASIGVVKAKAVATLEQRVDNALDPTVRQILSAAIEKIRFWSPDYDSSYGRIRKDDAVNMINSALHEYHNDKRRRS